MEKLNKNFSRSYSKEKLNHVAFPLGGIGAGMICIEGSGAISHVSLKNKPEIFNEPCIFSALTIKKKGGNIAKILEGAVPKRKVFGYPDAGNGGGKLLLGIPRFEEVQFSWDFPFCTIKLADKDIPLDVELKGWSPFIPNEEDDSSLPFAGLEFKFRNISNEKIEAMYSFNAENIVSIDNKDEKTCIKQGKNSFICYQPPLKGSPWEESAFCARVDDCDTKVDCQWFRGGWFDPRTMLWKNIQQCNISNNEAYSDKKGESKGGTLAVQFTLEPEEEKTIKLMLTWYTPKSNIRMGQNTEAKTEEGCCSGSCCSETNVFFKEEDYYQPWYSGKFNDIEELADYVANKYCELRNKSLMFSNCFYDSTLPDEVLDAVSANLTILKSPTVLRQKDGRIWAWEGCSDESGCCAGSCSHVWNYAQAMPHLFSRLERGMRETEFFESQDSKGHQNFRVALPIGPTDHKFHAASDGELGCIMKVYREWRISGDDKWLKKILPNVIDALNYCIGTWDPDHIGVLLEPHHNTYDIEFWGADAMCTTFYLGALQSIIIMMKYCNHDTTLYEEILHKGIRYIEKNLFNGEYFIQKIQWNGLKATDPLKVMSFGGDYSPEAIEIMKREGPKYQYGEGCLSDGILGVWIALMCGLENFIDDKKIKSHLKSIYKYNFKTDLSKHCNLQRPTYALGKEGGLLLCSWPKGGELTLPFVYSNEVWTGFEYQVASHLASTGYLEKALNIVKEARKRYDGSCRNPFNEYECGHWYARAMSSYGLLQGITGIKYDAITHILTIAPKIKGDFRSFFSTAFGYGTAGVRKGEPFVEIKQGRIKIKSINFRSF